MSEEAKQPNAARSGEKHKRNLGERKLKRGKSRKKERISSTSVVSSSSGETLISGSKTNVASTRRTPGSAETPHKAKIEVIAATMRTYERTDVGVFEKLNLYILNDQFFLEPRDRTGELAASTYLEIDRVTNDLRVWDANESPIPIVHAEIRSIFGVVGVVKLISGNGLIVVKRAELVGQVNGHDIWTILETDIIPSPHRETGSI
ncbi:hypothetical protein L596_008423 [Steinernema carpocapsae]|uniref:Uncharacterized protein n=2 Tax=Steinernema carpocapsae TaxID=34508 RepID=A0A4U5PCK8_STECR|nr:hypothetical protein L596_008423 [Steinernema carpocapsae]